MQYSLFRVFLSAIVLSICCAEQRSTRAKRFLRPEIFPVIPESLLRFGDYARDLSESLTAQAAQAVQHVVPETQRAVNQYMPQFSRFREELEPQEKSRPAKVPFGRETEGDESEVEVFDPVQVHKPSRPPQAPAGGFNPFIPLSFSFGLYTPWWNGPNICVEQDEVDEPQQNSTDIPGLSFNFETTRCIPSDTTYVCTRKIQTNGMRKTIIVRRQCCHGYIKRTDGRPGCSALKMENLFDTLQTLKMDKFARWVEDAGLKEKLQTENLTVFTPSNDAMIDYEDDAEDNEISAINPVRRFTDQKSIIQGHIAEGFLNIDLLDDEKVLKTLDEQATIRINKYLVGKEMITANCVPISGKNNFATNGVIHLINGVILVPKKTIAEILDTDPQFSIFRRLLSEKGLLDDLKKVDKSWTLFAPTDAAFEKLPAVLREQIESGQGCVESILHQHLTKGTICMSAVVTQIRLKNVIGNILKLTKDENEKLKVDGVNVDMMDIVGSNGVVHSLEEVLIPPQARSLLKALEEEERRDMLELIEAADLVSRFEGMQNVTFFVPTVEAIKSLTNKTYQEMLEDQNYLKKILLHHVIQPHTQTSSFSDNKPLTTANGQSIHIKLHEFFPGVITGATAQCAFIVSPDNQACGAVIHKINKVLMPPKGNIMDILKDMGDHDILRKLLKGTKIEQILEEDGQFTFLAPTDEAFERLSESFLEELENNKTKVEELLKLHLIPEILCCNSVSHGSPFQRQFVRTYDGSVLPLHRGLHDKVRFGRARAHKCDVTATNGLVHSINRVILPQRPTSTIFGLDLWPFF